MRWRGAVIVAVVAVASSTVHAQEREAVLITVDTEAPEARTRAWQRRVGEALGETTTLARWVRERQPVATVDPPSLEVIERIEALLVRAKAAAMRLQERDALGLLAEAEDLAERSLEVPGMAAWYAEVQLAIAVTSAQAGMEGLSAAALRRAASVDPSRGVQAAEARPEVVERGRAAIRAAAVAPRGRFAVRADAPGATVSLDDRPLGRLPRTVEATVGPHVLRVDAPGRRGWARVITVYEGERPAIEVRLSPTELAATADAVTAAARRGDVEAVAAGLARLERAGDPAPRVWLLRPGAGARDRALLLGCEPAGCGAVRRLEGDGAPSITDRSIGAAGEGFEAALAWSAADREPVLPPDEPPWWERWYLWVGAGAVIAAAVTAAIVAAAPRGQGPWQVDVGWGTGW